MLAQDIESLNRQVEDAFEERLLAHKIKLPPRSEESPKTFSQQVKAARYSFC